MDEYICCERLKGQTISGYVNIPYRTYLRRIEDYIVYGSKVICLARSNLAHKHLSQNRDGKGLERFRLSHGIMHLLNYNSCLKNRELVDYRWSLVFDDETCKKYRRKEIADDWLWAHEFYEGPIEDLEYIYHLVNVLHVPKSEEE